MSLPLEAAGSFQHKISIYSSNLRESIFRAAVIVLARAQDGARKLRLIWAVGVCLRLNGDAAVRPVRGDMDEAVYICTAGKSEYTSSRVPPCSTAQACSPASVKQWS